MKKFMSENLHLNLSRKHVYDLMLKLGYRWTYGKKRGSRIIESEQKQADTWRLALEWSQALQLEESGTHVVVYMDESFVNTGHCHRMSWFLIEQSLIQFDDDGKVIINENAIPVLSDDASVDVKSLRQQSGKGIHLMQNVWDEKCQN